MILDHVWAGGAVVLPHWSVSLRCIFCRLAKSGLRLGRRSDQHPADLRTWELQVGPRRPNLAAGKGWTDVLLLQMQGQSWLTDAGKVKENDVWVGWKGCLRGDAPRFWQKMPVLGMFPMDLDLLLDLGGHWAGFGDLGARLCGQALVSSVPRNSAQLYPHLGLLPAKTWSRREAYECNTATVFKTAIWNLGFFFNL